MEARLRFAVAHCIAIIEDAGPDYAVGVWFPDLPGCTSAGDDVDEALRNAPEALQLYAESFAADGTPMPHPRTLTELKADPEIAEDIKSHMVALLELPLAPTQRNDSRTASGRRHCGKSAYFCARCPIGSLTQSHFNEILATSRSAAFTEKLSVRGYEST
jgi:predicted RNase H-like HicB family nuclease